MIITTQTLTHPNARIGEALVNGSKVAYGGLVLSVFNPDNTYNATNWSNGDLITEAHMNKIEDAIRQIRLEQLNKFDDVTVSQIDDRTNKLTFFANGVAKRTIEIICNCTPGSEPDPEPDPEPGTLIIDYPESSVIDVKTAVSIPYQYHMKNTGESTLYAEITVNGSKNTLSFIISEGGTGTIDLGTMAPGKHTIVLYVIDSANLKTNETEITIICESDSDRTIFALDTTILDQLTYKMPTDCSYVDWGDGTSSSESGATHTYAEHGTYTISAEWVFNAYSFSRCNSWSSAQTTPIINITHFGSIPEGTDGSYTFFNLAATSLDLSSLESGNLTSFKRFFYGCKNLVSINFGDNFDTSNATNMNRMFYNCSKLTELDLSSFDTNKITDMSYMFHSCSSLTELDLSSFDTSNVTDMSSMFYNCSSLTTLDLSSFDTSNVTNMRWIFAGCEKLSLDVSNFNTSKVTNMSEMFYSCSSLTELDLSNFNTSLVTNMSLMFAQCIGLTSLNLSSFDTSKATDMARMFSSCENLTSLDVSSFDTSNVEDMQGMFNSCEKLVALDLSNFNTSNVTDMKDMFAYCNSLTELDLSNFDTSKVTDMYEMFYYCTKLTAIDLSSFNTSNVTDMSHMFYGCKSLISLDLSNFDMSATTDSNDMFIVCNFSVFVPPNNISSSISFSPLKQLTYETLLDILNNLATVETTQTLTLNALSIALLTPEEIAIGVNKNWDVVGA